MTLLDRLALARPTSLDEALAQLAAPGAVPLAGGTDLVNGIRLGHRAPDAVVDLAGVPELAALDDGDPVRLGAGVTVRGFRGHATLPHRLPALADAAGLLGGRQVQAMATLGGNLCNASPAAELATPLLVLDATALIAGPTRSRRIPLAELWTGPGRTALGADELLVALELPRGLDAAASAYRRLELRRSVDIALVSASCRLTIRNGRIAGARLALGAVAPTPLLADGAAEALVDVEVASGDAVTEAVREAGRRAANAARPIDDVRASATYRRAMVEQVVRRAVDAALDRAGRRRADGRDHGHLQ